MITSQRQLCAAEVADTRGSPHAGADPVCRSIMWEHIYDAATRAAHTVRQPQALAILIPVLAFVMVGVSIRKCAPTTIQFLLMAPPGTAPGSSCSRAVMSIWCPVLSLLSHPSVSACC